MSLRTVTLPINPGASAALAWPAKSASDLLPYSLDCGPWLSDGGLTMSAAPVVEASPDLAVSSVALTGGVVSMMIGGGTAGQSSFVRVTLDLDAPDTARVLIEMPVRPADPDGLVMVGAVPVSPSGVGPLFATIL